MLPNVELRNAEKYTRYPLVVIDKYGQVREIHGIPYPPSRSAVLRIPGIPDGHPLVLIDEISRVGKGTLMYVYSLREEGWIIGIA